MVPPYPASCRCLPAEQQVAGEMGGNGKGQNHPELPHCLSHRVRPQIHASLIPHC